jgi:hypothetical protein
MDLLTETQMEGMSPDKQALKAIAHILTHIRRGEYVGWYLGVGTQSFSLLTEAYATLPHEDVGKVRELFEPKNPRNPKEDSGS